MRLELAGPPTVPPGGTAQFTLLALMSDGLMRDVTATAVWQTSSGNLLTVSAGLATGRNRGDATINARHAGLSAVKSVMIVPTGTFRLIGAVQETVPPLGPVPGVRIEVAEGTERGLSTNTAPDGSFRLYGVTGDVELRLSKAGYATRTERLTVTDHQSQDFGIAIVTPLTDLSGRYALTIRAAPACDQAPEDMRERRYTADITQAGPLARVTLSGATFPAGYYGGGLNQFYGTVEPGLVRFVLSFYYYLPPVMEQLSPTRYFTASGILTVSIGAGALTGTLNGTLDIREGSDKFRLKTVSECRSDQHLVTFMRVP